MLGEMSNVTTIRRLSLRFLGNATKLASPLGEQLIKFFYLSLLFSGRPVVPLTSRPVKFLAFNCLTDISDTPRKREHRSEYQLRY